jgi:hypothetical protein
VVIRREKERRLEEEPIMVVMVGQVAMAGMVMVERLA